MKYNDAIAEIESLGIMPTSLPQIDSMRRALDRSGLLSRIDSERSIVIAGTNGKGSTAATLSALIHATGSSVGLYTSPHLVSACERIRVAERDIAEDEFVQAYAELRSLIRAEGLTHFEALTLIAAYVFYSGKTRDAIDWSIWEVGLGGLFDATNAIPHRFCAITALGLDHQAILGSALREIAFQKLGIIGTGAVVVHGAFQAEIEPLRAETSLRTDCRWIGARSARALALDRIETPWGVAPTSLLGDRAAQNSAIALTLFEALGWDPRAHLHALSEVRWPGRFSQAPLAGFACPVYLSGDHNPQGVESLLSILRSLERTAPWERIHVIVGIGKDKDAREMLERLETLRGLRLYLTQTPFKPLPIAEYPARLKEGHATRDADPWKALARAREAASSQDMVLVTGSLYLVGEILAHPGRIA
jgi:dihydrofolate synthase/folylpolyglutamate synthase